MRFFQFSTNFKKYTIVYNYYMYTIIFIIHYNHDCNKLYPQTKLDNFVLGLCHWSSCYCHNPSTLCLGYTYKFYFFFSNFVILLVELQFGSPIFMMVSSLGCWVGVGEVKTPTPFKNLFCYIKLAKMFEINFLFNYMCPLTFISYLLDLGTLGALPLGECVGG
jgi:hypothetical protein